MQRYCRPAARAWRSRAPRRGISLTAILVSIVIVLLATAATLSTLVARRAIAERDRATEDFEKAFGTIDEIVRAASASNDLKGFKMMATREALLNPALNYYQAYAQAHLNDDPPIPTVVDAQLHSAGLQAKLGSMKSTDSITQSMQYFGSMIGTTMKIAQPGDWMVLKGAGFDDLPKHGFKLLMAINMGVVTFREIAKDSPQAVRPREDLAGLLTASGMLQGQLRRNKEALGQVSQAIAVIETLVRDRPADEEYKNQLAGTLVNAARLQKTTKDIPAAKESYQKAIEIREQQIAAKPDDKALAAELETAKTELAKLPAVEQAAAPAEPAAEGAAAEEAPAEAAATPAEEPAEPAADSAAATP